MLSGQPIAVRRAAHAQRLRCTPAGLAAALRGLGTGALPPLWERLGELRMPVTLIVGARDHKFGADRPGDGDVDPRGGGGRNRRCRACGAARGAAGRRGGARSGDWSYQLSRPSPRPEPPGTAIAPPRGGSGSRASNSAERRQSTRAVGHQRRGGMQCGRDPQRAVERRGEVHLVAHGPGPAGAFEQPAEPAAARDLQAYRGAPLAVERARAGGRSRRARSAPPRPRPPARSPSARGTAPRSTRSRPAQAHGASRSPPPAPMRRWRPGGSPSPARRPPGPRPAGRLRPRARP